MDAQEINQSHFKYNHVKERKTMTKKVLTLTLSIMITLSLGGCTLTDQVNDWINPNSLPEPIQRNIGEDLTVSIEPQVQLLEVVQLLADFDELAESERLNSSKRQYRQAIEKHFTPFKNDPVIKTYQEMYKKGYWYDIAVEGSLIMTRKFEINPTLNLDEDLRFLEGCGGKEQLEILYKQLLEFKNVSNFNAFYREQKPFLESELTQTCKLIEKNNPIEAIKIFYNVDQVHYNMIIQPIAKGGYAVSLDDKTQGQKIYNVMVIPYNDKELCRLMIHEFSHAYVNPETEKYLKLFSKYDGLYQPIETVMTRRAYGNWQGCFDEHVVRACTAYLMGQLYNESVKNELIKREEGSGFIYIEDISKSIDNFAENRDQYPTFDGFYPKLSLALDEALKRQ
jgi:hypothetical protein